MQFFLKELGLSLSLLVGDALLHLNHLRAGRRPSAGQWAGAWW